MFTTMENDDVFYEPYSENPPLAEMRKLTFRRVKRLFAYDFCPMEDVMNNPLLAHENIMSMGMYDWSLAAKYMLSLEVRIWRDAFGY